ncbi:MAG TPA: hypothetical protein PKN63_08630 [Chitinophagales bacterium]|nr:hypothetical protein [Chitinophagales bacterium]
MEKSKELLKKFGFIAEKVEDENFDIEKAFADFQKKQEDLFMQRQDLLEPILTEKVKTANIISAKKTKKAINEFFGLGKTEKELNDIEIQDLLDAGKTGLNLEVSKDVKEHQAKIVELQNQIAQIQEAKAKELEDVKNEYSKKEKQAKISNIINSELTKDVDFLIGKDKVVKLFESSAKDAGFEFDIDDENNFIIKKGNYRAMTSDNTKFADLSNLRETLIGDLIKKSNGGGGQPPHNGGGADHKTIYPENLPKHMRERLEAMNQKASAI